MPALAPVPEGERALQSCRAARGGERSAPRPAEPGCGSSSRSAGAPGADVPSLNIEAAKKLQSRSAGWGAWCWLSCHRSVR